MTSLRFDFHGLAFGLAAAMIAGCGSQSQGAVFAAVPQTATPNLIAGHGLGTLKYFSAPPNGRNPGNNLIVGPDGNLWYTNDVQGKAKYTITKFSPGGQTIYTVPSCRGCGRVQPSALVSGPDARIWFGTVDSHVIGAMDTNGTVHYYKGPEPYCTSAKCSFQLGAVIGQDIWFTTETLSASFGFQLLVGYIDASTGETKAYATGNEKVGPTQISLGTYDALWFGAGTNVAETQSGLGVNEFETYPSMQVGSIIAGPDSTMWFASDGQNQMVGIVKSDGEIRDEYSVGQTTYQLALGPDNHVWLTTADGLVRMASPTRSQNVSVPDKYRACVPAGLTVGADGHLWFSSTSSLGQSCSYGIATLVPKSQTPATKDTDLLYVSEIPTSKVFVYSYPQGTLVRTITGVLHPEGECVDAAGNVYVANGAADDVSEFKHGGAKATAYYNDGGYKPYACSVDPTTGNLAVTEYGTRDEIAIFSGPSTFPAQYRDPRIFSYYSCAYDAQGNLFVDGYDDNRKFEFAELPKGSGTFERIVLDRHFKGAGNIQWDGSYITVSDNKNVIYQFAISGTKGKTVGSTKIDGVSTGLRLFSIQDGIVTVPNAYGGSSPSSKGAVQLYQYPQGGMPTQSVTGIAGPADGVISFASSAESKTH